MIQFQSPPAQVPEHFLGVHGLGSALEVYPVSAVHRWVSAIFGALLIGGAGLVIVYGLYDTFVQVAKYGLVMLSETIVIPALLSGVLLLFGGLAVVNAYLNWEKMVVVYEWGLAYHDHQGLQTWDWQEVEWLFVAITKHYYNGIYASTSYLYTLKKADGSRLKLDHKFERIEGLGRWISRKTAPYQYERLAEQVRNGRTVRLGPVSLDKDQIGVGQKTYPWSEIARVSVRNGYVNLQKQGGGWLSGANAPVSAIPNLEAFLAVADQIIRVKTG